MRRALMTRLMARRLGARAGEIAGVAGDDLYIFHGDAHLRRADLRQRGLQSLTLVGCAGIDHDFARRFDAHDGGFATTAVPST